MVLISIKYICSPIKLFRLQCSMWWTRHTNQDINRWMSTYYPYSTGNSRMHEPIRTSHAATRRANCHLQPKQPLLRWYSYPMLQVSLGENMTWNLSVKYIENKGPSTWTLISTNLMFLVRRPRRCFTQFCSMVLQHNCRLLNGENFKQYLNK